MRRIGIVIGLRTVGSLLISPLFLVVGCAAPARSEKMVAEIATPAPAKL
jgi:hypothetical protein